MAINTEEIATGPGAALPHFGFKLKEARRRVGLTQAELAAQVGVTKGFISQLENNSSQVSVAKLLRICEVVGVEIGTLFQRQSEELIRRDERTEVMLGGHGVRDYLLTPPNQRSLRIIEAHLEPKANSGAEPYSLRCDVESVIVQSGELEIELEGKLYLLATGDSLTFDGGIRHRWRNPSQHERATALWTLAL